MTYTELNALIQRYFNGETSTADETRLRKELLTTRFESPAIDEARAVMGFMAARRVGRHAGYKPVAARPYLTVRFRAVAAVAVLVVTAMVLAITNRAWFTDGSADVMAYSGGHVITDHEAVAAMVEMQLHSVAEASVNVNATVESELKSVSAILTELNM